MQEKCMLEETLQSMQHEYKTAKQEVLVSKDSSQTIRSMKNSTNSMIFCYLSFFFFFLCQFIFPNIKIEYILFCMQDNKEALKSEKEENKKCLNGLQQEIRDLKAKNKTLNENASSNNSSSSTKIKKLKEKLDELSTNNETLKVIFIFFLKSNAKIFKISNISKLYCKQLTIF